MERTLTFESNLTHVPFPVQLEISCYQNNGCLYIGITDVSEEYPEPYGDVTVILSGKVPDYCGYVDINNMPELEEFIAENELGEFTGFVKRSGFCEYTLYLFNAEKLRELCPDGMLMYEHSIGKDKKPEHKMEKAR